MNPYLTRQALTIGQQLQASPQISVPPSHLAHLPQAIAQLHRLQIYPPLSLVQDLLQLTGGQEVSRLAALAQTEIRHLVALRWSLAARLGFVALLLADIPFPEWVPPAEVNPRTLYQALKQGLTGASTHTEAPTPPLALLQANARRIDDHLLNLLQILGEEVVAAEPSLPLRLLPRVSEIPLLNSLQRQLLGVKICFGEKAGCSSGSAPNAERGQVSGVENSRRTDWISLLPSQLALPQEVRDYRYFRGELLFRTRTLPDPPELRPTILILDVSPTTAGEIEDMLRLAAFALTRALYQAQVPVVLITPGDRQDGVISLEHPSDWVEIWTQQSPAPVNEVRLLRLAKAVQANLRSTSNQEPIILLLSQPWFGAEAKIASLSGLRGLFVQYPDYEEEEPFLVSACDRWATLFPHEGADLGRALGYVLG